MPGLVWGNPRSLRTLGSESSCPTPISSPRMMLARCSCLPFLFLRPAGEAPGSSGGPPMRSLSTTSSGSSSGAAGPSGLARQNSTSLTGKLGALPANLDDMKVGGRPFPLEPLPASSATGAGLVLVCRESSQCKTHGHVRQSRAPDCHLLQRRPLEPASRLAWPCHL